MALTSSARLYPATSPQKTNNHPLTPRAASSSPPPSPPQIYLLLSCCPCEGRISGIVDVPNACCTLAVPVAIFDQDIRPKKGGPPTGARLVKYAQVRTGLRACVCVCVRANARAARQFS
jgi:hypothetical protein